MLTVTDPPGDLVVPPPAPLTPEHLTTRERESFLEHCFRMGIAPAPDIVPIWWVFARGTRP